MVFGGELLGEAVLVDLVPLGAVTTSLGTLDPLDYGHFMLIDVRHKNVFMKCK